MLLNLMEEIILIYLTKLNSFKENLMKKFLVYRLKVECHKFLIFPKNLKIDIIKEKVSKDQKSIWILLDKILSIKNMK